MRFSATIGLSAAFLSLVSAKGCKQQPVGENPSGNAIATPSLNQAVPAGKPFEITWTPTTPGRVSIVLLRGTSTNIKPIGCIVDSVPNTGKFSWAVPTSLEPDVTHYGIQIVVDGTGQYQYSTQFGVSNPSFGHEDSHSTHTKKHTTTQAHQHTATAMAHPTSKTAEHDHSAPAHHHNNTTKATPSLIATNLPPVPTATGSGGPHHHPYHNGTLPHPTGNLTVPHSLQTHHRTTKTAHTVITPTVSAQKPTTASTTSSSSAPLAQPTNAAAHFAPAGAVVAGLGAVVVLVL